MVAFGGLAFTSVLGDCLVSPGRDHSSETPGQRIGLLRKGRQREEAMCEAQHSWELSKQKH